MRMAVDAAAFAIIVASANAKKHGPTAHMGSIGNRAGDGCGNRADQDVVVSDVGKLVSDYAFQFVVVHNLEQSLGDSDRGMTGTSAGGEGVRRRVRHDE